MKNILGKKSFKIKLISSYVIVVLVSLGFVTFFLDKKLEEDSLLNIENSLINQAYLVAGQITASSLKSADAAYLEPLVASLGRKIKCRITVINTAGKVLADSEKPQQDIQKMENHLNRPEVKTALGGGTGIDLRYSSTLKIDMLYVALPLRDNNEIAGILRMALPLESVKETLKKIRKTVLFSFFFALGLAVVLGSVIAVQTIKPVNRMIYVSRKFSEGDFSRRIILHSKDEIGDLAETLNRMAQDIEDKIKEIGSQNQKLAAIFNSMIEGIIAVDNRGNIVSVNPAVLKIFGVARKDIEGRPFLEAIRNNDISEIIGSVLRAGEPVSREINLVLPVRGVFRINATPIFDKSAVSGCLAVIHDITKIRELETMRRDFVANVSHELKTPLTSIKGFVETLLEGALDDKENNRRFLTIIQDHAERLNNLVEDLLSLSHLESKEAGLDKEGINVRQQFEEVILGFKSQIKKRGIDIKNELREGLSVTADKDRIKQVATNLIDNAIKFNKPKGSIRISGADLSDGVKIIVEDSGIGIPQKNLSRIFERFYRVDKARSRELGGTGLGLSIVKHIVELHGGSVGVESIEGLGSKFWFILPE